MNKPGKVLHADMNRYYLVQMCSECELQIANTFTEHDFDNLVTYREIWYENGARKDSSNHELLDLALIQQKYAHRLSGLRCISNLAFKSHHSIVVADFDVDLASVHKQSPRQQLMLQL